MWMRMESLCIWPHSEDHTLINTDHTQIRDHWPTVKQPKTSRADQSEGGCQNCHHTGYSNLVSTVVAFRPESESVWFNIEKRIAVLWGNQNAFSCGTDDHPFFDLRNTDRCLYKQLLCVFHVPCLNWWDLPKLSNFSSFQQNAEHFPWQEAGRGQLGAFLRLSWVGRSKQEDQGPLTSWQWSRLSRGPGRVTSCDILQLMPPAAAAYFD